MIEWVEELRAGFTEEFGTGPKVVTLATVDGAGRPRARSVVCRRFGETELEEGLLLVASDARSRKNDELTLHAPAEVCAWLPKIRSQYRLHCRSSLIARMPPAAGPMGEAMTNPGFGPNLRNFREQVWSEMSESARALFFWPDPGQPLVADPSQFPAAVRTGLPPDTFVLIALIPDEVECLDLRQHPHRRRRWRTDGQVWTVEELNP